MRLAGAGQASRLGGGDQGEFHAMAHGVDAFGADADTVAEFPDEGSGFLATATTTALSTWNGDEGVLALAMHDARAAGFLERADGQEPFHKNFEEFDEAAVFLHGNDERLYSSPR